MIDAAADAARRVLHTCRYCFRAAQLYLLASEANMVFVQCPRCTARYWVDTGCGKGRPDYVDVALAWPL